MGMRQPKAKHLPWSWRSAVARGFSEDEAEIIKRWEQAINREKNQQFKAKRKILREAKRRTALDLRNKAAAICQNGAPHALERVGDSLYCTQCQKVVQMGRHLRKKSK